MEDGPNRYFKEAPGADGLYDPALEKEACGVGFVVHIDGIRSNKVLEINLLSFLLCYPLFCAKMVICIPRSFSMPALCRQGCSIAVPGRATTTQATELEF